jgi:hypothetical protein
MRGKLKVINDFGSVHKKPKLFHWQDVPHSMRAKIFVLAMAFNVPCQIGHRVSALFEANVPEQENK